MKRFVIRAVGLFIASKPVAHRYSSGLFSTNTSSLSTFGKFDPNHHRCLREAYASTMEWWKQATQEAGGHRCRTCWNLHYNCLCDYLTSSRNQLVAVQEGAQTVSLCPNVNIHLYYDLKELGRCTNTGHLLEILCPQSVTSCVFGDVEAENKLIEAIHREHLDSCPSTCILYPAKDAVPLSEWLSSRSDKSRPVTIVALDGTYSTAPTLLKHLRNRCALLGIPTPVVKLDLEGGQHSSTIAEIKPQPRGDKICTYEAIVLAMKQIGISEAYCDHLLQDLGKWKQHIIDRKIKG